MNFWPRIRAALRGRPRGQAVILMYHRIADEPVDPWRLCVAPSSFAAQLDWLRSHCRVVPLRQLAAELRDGRLGRRTVGISFDDGYADNLLAAEPLLRERGLPATFFVTTATLGAQREFWWDELERLLMRPESLPAALRVRVAGEERTFRPGSAAKPCDPQEECGRARPWEAAAGSRLGFYYEVWNALRPLDEAQRRHALLQLSDQVGPLGEAVSARRTMTQAELGRLADSPVAHIGAHSVTHATFLSRTADEQRWEMQESKRDLESMLRREVPGFAYPFGDAGSESAGLALAVGFEFACTTEAAPVTSTTSPHLLPRVAVEDRDARTFGAQVTRLLA